MLPDVKVVGVGDAAFTPLSLASDEMKEKYSDIAARALDPTAAQRRIDVWNPAPDASCVAKLGVSNCMSALPVAYDHTTTPLFQRMAQRDKNPLGKMDIKRGSAFEDDYATLVREAIGKLDAGFAPNNRRHCIITGEEVRSEKIDGVSFLEAVGNWVHGRKGPTKLIQQ